MTPSLGRAGVDRPHSEQQPTEETAPTLGNPEVEIRSVENLRIVLQVTVLTVSSDHVLAPI